MTAKTKIQPRAARGFRDRRSDELLLASDMAAKIGEIYQLWGFEPLEQPLVEYTECLGKFLPDKERPNEGVFSFQDDDGQWLSLRYDLTAPLSRFYAENSATLPKPFRSFRNGWVFRNEKAKAGRFRQFLQFDADTVGTASPAADAELCMLGVETLRKLGIKDGDFVIRVNNRKIIDGLIANLSVAVDEEQKLNIMRTMDKLDKVGMEGVEALLGDGRLDESGDFIPGAKLPKSDRDYICLFLATTAPSNEDTIASMKRLMKGSERGLEGVAELAMMQEIFATNGYTPKEIRIDASIVRGLEYYTGAIFEAELTFKVRNQDGEIVQFGSVGGGGRYDGLVSRFTDEPVPATGFSVGLSRLMAALRYLQTDEPLPFYKAPVVILMLDSSKEYMAKYQDFVSFLREEGIPAEIYLGSGGLKAQMKYADKRGAPCVMIYGAKEKENGVVAIKDLKQGREISKTITSNEEWLKNNAAQQEVPVTDWLSTVLKIVRS